MFKKAYIDQESQSIQFFIISGGRLMHENIELLGAARMTDLVQEMKTHYPDRYVLFDVPPILSSADALACISC